MYPTIVIGLVETQRSLTDICEIGPSNASRLAGPVASGYGARSASLGRPSFAVRPVNSATDNEADYLPSRGLQSRDVQERGLEKVIQLEVNMSRSRVTAIG